VLQSPLEIRPSLRKRDALLLLIVAVGFIGAIRTPAAGAFVSAPDEWWGQRYLRSENCCNTTNLGGTWASIRVPASTGPYGSCIAFGVVYTQSPYVSVRQMQAGTIRCGTGGGVGPCGIGGTLQMYIERIGTSIGSQCFAHGAIAGTTLNAAGMQLQAGIVVPFVGGYWYTNQQLGNFVESGSNIYAWGEVAHLSGVNAAACPQGSGTCEFNTWQRWRITQQDWFTIASSSISDWPPNCWLVSNITTNFLITKP
jgi:hypothetical protein